MINNKERITTSMPYWNINIETLEKWSHEIVYYWETHAPAHSPLGGKPGRYIKSKEYRSKRMALISWQNFAEDNKIEHFRVIDSHRSVQLA